MNDRLNHTLNAVAAPQGTITPKNTHLGMPQTRDTVSSV